MSDPVESVVVECELPDPPEKVWRALTEPDLVAEWLTADEPAPIEREVVLEEPPRLLRYAWRDGSDVESLVTFELERTSGGGTNLRVVHTGISQTIAEAADGPRWAARPVAGCGRHHHGDRRRLRTGSRAPTVCMLKAA